MARTSIEDRFADLNEWAGPTFRAAELPEVSRRAKRRRVRRRAFVTAAIAALAVLPAVAFAVVTAGRDNSQPIGPTAPPVSPTPAVPTFRTTLPGEPVSDQPPRLSFVDRLHVWMYSGACGVPDPQACRHRLLASADGGRTWRQAGFPQVSGTDTVDVTPMDANTVVVYAAGQGIWLTMDGGASYTRHPFNQAPIQAKIAADRAYAIKCPSQTGYGSGEDASVADCSRQQLVKTGVGPTRYQPPWRGPDVRVDEVGRDGRIWLIDGNRMAYSPDEGKTWHQVKEMPFGKLQLSANGEHAGVFANDRQLYRLIGDEWVVEPKPAAWSSPVGGVLLDDGSWLVSDFRGSGYLTGGVYTRIQELDFTAKPIEQLTDGTLVLSHRDLTSGQHGFYMGTGQGRDRQWTLVIY